MEQNTIQDSFGNEDNIYYGHGIGDIDRETEESERIINSIFANGLRASHYALSYTTVGLRKWFTKSF